MMRRALLLLLPLMLVGADCPGSDAVDMWVVVDVLTVGVETEEPPPAQSLVAKVRFRRETASRDLELAAATSVSGAVFAPDEALTDDPLPRAESHTDATLLFRNRSSGRTSAVEALGGTFDADGIVPGSYHLTVIPDAYKFRYSFAYDEVEIPGADLSTLLVDWGHELTAEVVEFDLANLAQPILEIADLEIEAFAETEPGVLRRAGPRATTDSDGRFTLHLVPGSYTLRITSRPEAAAPYPTALLTGFRVPEDIDALNAEAEAEGAEVPTLYTYPHFERRSLSGRLVATGPMGSESSEGNASVMAWGVVEAPQAYIGRDDVDFVIGSMRKRVFTSDNGDFAFGQEGQGLPAGAYGLDIVPGYYSDASSESWIGDQALDLHDDGLQLGDITLDSRVYLNLRVIDHRGREVDNARVEVRNLGVSGYVTAARTGAAEGVDAPGTARMFLEQGPHEVTVVPPVDSTLARRSFEVEIGSAGRVMEVDLEEGIHVSGRVSVDDELLGGVQIRFSDPDGTLLGIGESRPSGTYELRVPTTWAWPDIDAVGDDDDSAE
jgi:hypothetical protein